MLSTCTYKLFALSLSYHQCRMDNATQYQILYKRLKQEILADVYQVGSVLPSENELCATANLSRSTVRQALGQLEKEGYIFKQKGKGSIVKSKSRALNLLSFQGFSSMVESSRQSTLGLQEPQLQPWPSPFLFMLSELEQGAGCIYFSRVRCIDNLPVMYERTYLPNLNLPRFTRLFKLEDSFFEFLGKVYQVEIVGMDQSIWAIAAAEEVAAQLGLKPGAPVLKISRKYFTNRPHLHLYSLLYCNTEKYAMSNASGQVNLSNT
jgi:DNA-binding GntR family transcriptional regulator